MAEKSINYFEDLNVGSTCPHEDAFMPDGERFYYRKLYANKVIDESFVAPPFNPDREEYADKCIQKSLSVFDDLESLLNAVFRTQAGKRKMRKIALLKLLPNDGVLKQTFGKNHHSWWRSQAFDVASVTVQEIEI